MTDSTPSDRLRRALDRKPDATRVDLTREMAEALLAQLAAERANADALVLAVRGAFILARDARPAAYEIAIMGVEARLERALAAIQPDPEALEHIRRQAKAEDALAQARVALEHCLGTITAGRDGIWDHTVRPADLARKALESAEQVEKGDG